MIRYRAQCDCGYHRTFRSDAQATYALSQHSCERQQSRAAAAERYAQRMAAVDRTPKPCPHPQAQHRHGTNTTYHLDRCRCTPCSRAAVEYDRTRTRQSAYGRWRPYVDAQPVRDHVLALREQGVGWKRVAAVAGVSNGAMTKLLYGEAARNMAPSRRMRADSAARILAVTAGQARSPEANVPAGPTLRHVEGLVALGYPKAWIARQLGARSHALQIGRAGYVEARTAAAVSALADRVGDTPGPSERARQYAASRGWETPLERWANSLGALTEEVVDEIAVERALAGEPVKLTQGERVEAARQLLDRGLGVSAVAKQLRLSGATAAAVVERAKAS